MTSCPWQVIELDPMDSKRIKRRGLAKPEQFKTSHFMFQLFNPEAGESEHSMPQQMMHGVSEPFYGEWEEVIHVLPLMVFGNVRQGLMRHGLLVGDLR